MTIATSEMPLKLTLINSSPRLWGGTVIADFTVNREPGQYRVSCLLKGHQEKDCKSVLLASSLSRLPEGSGEMNGLGPGTRLA